MTKRNITIQEPAVTLVIRDKTGVIKDRRLKLNILTPLRDVMNKYCHMCDLECADFFAITPVDTPESLALQDMDVIEVTWHRSTLVVID